MFSCKEAARLSSEKLDRRLSLWERLMLRLHLAMCKACSVYSRQIEGLHRIFSLRGQTPSGESTTESMDEMPKLSPESRERMKRMLAAKQSDQD